MTRRWQVTIGFEQYMISYEQYLKLVSKYLFSKASTTAEEKMQMGDFELRQPWGCPHCNRAVWTAYERPRIAHDIESCGRNMSLKAERLKYKTRQHFEKKRGCYA
jgi:hypothetical protein